jgi:hypothetical protein
MLFFWNCVAFACTSQSFHRGGAVVHMASQCIFALCILHRPNEQAGSAELLNIFSKMPVSNHE